MKGDVRGERVTLRPLAAHYFDAYAQMFSPLIQHILHVPSVYHELDYLQLRIEKMAQSLTQFHCIFDNNDLNLIGALEIRARHEHPGQLYNWIHEDYWGNGRYQEAIALAAYHYFANSCDTYITAHVDIANVRSVHALKKSGFAHTGFFNGPHGKQYAMVLRKVC